ncbi:MAG: endonuclease domain-containing protein [Cyclobacteriaceae bacterium]
MGEDLHKGAPRKHFYYSRENRKQYTKAELVLWTYLRNRKLDGFKFRRQHPISDFIADFYSHECKLIIEIDGEYHNAVEQRQYDEGRSYELKELKIKVIRFTNEEVLKDIDFVLDEIGAYLSEYSNENDK